MSCNVSVVIPVYNAQEYLQDCVESIINQTLKDIEIIIVNDGSEDKSGEIAELCSKKDDRIKVIHKSNGGQAEARNHGI